jgi:hypothetical protein
MFHSKCAVSFSGLVYLASLTMAFSALAQAPRDKVDAAVTSGLPDYRDPMTGRIWTPANVGGVGGLNTPADRAFDPLAQATVVEGTVLQNPQVTQLATVPITAGPTVPIVSLGTMTLQAVPGQRWQLTMYLNNNSGNSVTPVLTCRFTNGDQVVQTTRATLPLIAGGARVGFTVYGPNVSLFVDRSGCQVDRP